MRHTPGGLKYIIILKFRIILCSSLFSPFYLHQTFPLLLRLFLFQCPDLLKSAHRHLGTLRQRTDVRKEPCLSGQSTLSHYVMKVRQRASLISLTNTESNLVASSRTSLITPLYDTHPGPSSLTKPPPRTSPLRRLDAKHS